MAPPGTLMQSQSALKGINIEQQIQLDQILHEHNRNKDQIEMVQSIKEDIIDAVNDLKLKETIWNLT